MLIKKKMAYSHPLQANPSAPISMFGQVRGFSYFQQNHNFDISNISCQKRALFALHYITRNNKLTRKDAKARKASDKKSLGQVNFSPGPIFLLN